MHRWISVAWLAMNSLLSAQYAMSDSLETFSNSGVPSYLIPISSTPAPSGGGVAVSNGTLAISHWNDRNRKQWTEHQAGLDPSSFMLCGDFALEIDYGIDRSPPVVSAGYFAESGIRFTRWRDGSNVCGLSRLTIASVPGLVSAGNYYRSWSTSSTLPASSFVPTVDLSGRFRIRRVGSIMSLDYEASAAWVSLRTITNATTDHLLFSLNVRNSAGASVKVRFDNLRTIDLNAPSYPGTADGLTQRTSVTVINQITTLIEPQTHGGALDRKTILPNSHLALSLDGGPSLWLHPFVVAYQFIPVSTSPVPHPSIPGAWLDPTQPGFDYLLNGYNDPNVWTQRVLSPQGTRLYMNLANATAPGTAVIQSWVVSPHSINGMMATSGAQVFDF